MAHQGTVWNTIPSFPQSFERESRDRMKNFYVYILCNKRNGTLYTGVTSRIIKRIYEHKNKLVDGFTRKYKLQRLVWYEIHKTAASAITREKRIKKWGRKWKLELIEKDNPGWSDLYDHICENPGFPINESRE